MPPWHSSPSHSCNDVAKCMEGGGAEKRNHCQRPRRIFAITEWDRSSGWNGMKRNLSRERRMQFSLPRASRFIHYSAWQQSGISRLRENETLEWRRLLFLPNRTALRKTRNEVAERRAKNRGDVKNPTNLENARGKGTGQPSSRMKEEKRFLQADKKKVTALV